MMTLLNPNSKRFEITWVDMLFPDKKEIDVLEDGKKIGIAKTVGSQWADLKFPFFDNNGSVVLTKRQKGTFSRGDYLDDGDGNHLGIATQPWFGKVAVVLKHTGQKIRKKTNHGKEILTAFGKRSCTEFENYQIKDPNDNVVAKVSLKIEEIPAQKKRFLKRSSTKYSCFMEILDEVYDRKILLGFFTLILVHLYNYRGGEGVGVGP